MASIREHHQKMAVQPPEPQNTAAVSLDPRQCSMTLRLSPTWDTLHPDHLDPQAAPCQSFALLLRHLKDIVTQERSKRSGKRAGEAHIKLQHASSTPDSYTELRSNYS
jgi:hypothetical protein